MPNWCNNVVDAKHSDPAKVQALIEALKNETFFEHIIPIGKWEYEKACNAWSTKWEASEISWMHFNETGIVELSFESAWCPPENVYAKMIEDGWQITAYFCELGMGFIGKFGTDLDGMYEESYTIGEDPLPNDMIDMFNIGDFFDEHEFVDNGDGTSTLQEIVDEPAE